MTATTLTAVAAEVVAAVSATPETTAVAKAAPRAARKTKDAAEPRRNDGARGRAGATAKTIARVIATLSAMARFTTAVASADTANREIATARHRTETKAFTTAP